jgi:beta-1,4-N-acetylglucosaminyltransferase
MIFVTVGSVAPFDELIEMVDTLSHQNELEFLAQIGNGTYIPKEVKWFRFEKTLDHYFRKADLVITHNGAGTLFELLRLRKKIVAVPNPKTVQMKNMDIVAKLSDDGYILKCMSLEKLGEVIQQANSWTGRVYEPPECRIADIIAEYLLHPAKQPGRQQL